MPAKILSDDGEVIFEFDQEFSVTSLFLALNIAKFRADLANNFLFNHYVDGLVETIFKEMGALYSFDLKSMYQSIQERLSADEIYEIIKIGVQKDILVIESNQLTEGSFENLNRTFYPWSIAKTEIEDIYFKKSEKI